MRAKKISLALGSLVLMVAFQNCSQKASFAADPGQSLLSLDQPSVTVGTEMPNAEAEQSASTITANEPDKLGEELLEVKVTLPVQDDNGMKVSIYNVILVKEQAEVQIKFQSDKGQAKSVMADDEKNQIGQWLASARYITRVDDCDYRSPDIQYRKNQSSAVTKIGGIEKDCRSLELTSKARQEFLAFLRTKLKS